MAMILRARDFTHSLTSQPGTALFSDDPNAAAYAAYDGIDINTVCRDLRLISARLTLRVVATRDWQGQGYHSSAATKQDGSE